MTDISGLPVSGFILAGGESRRMGRDKAELRWGDATLLDHMVARLGLVARTVRVVGRGEWPDRHPGRGPLEGIRTALGVTTTENNIVAAVDLPLLDGAFLRYFVERHVGARADLLVCRVDGRIPLCLGIRPRLLPALDDYLESGRRSFQGFVESVEYEVVSEAELKDHGLSPGMFRNINTPEDYSRITGSA